MVNQQFLASPDKLLIHERIITNQHQNTVVAFTA